MPVHGAWLVKNARIEYPEMAELGPGNGWMGQAVVPAPARRSSPRDERSPSRGWWLQLQGGAIQVRLRAARRGLARGPSREHTAWTSRTSVERLRNMGAPFLSGIDDTGALALRLGLRVEDDQRLLAHLDRLLPELDLGEDAHAEYGLCLLAAPGDHHG